MKSQWVLAQLCAVAVLCVSASAFADDAKCRDAFIKANRNVGNQEQKANRKCIKDNLTGDATGCVDGESQKALDKRSKVNDLFLPGGKCATLPAFGVNPSPGNGDDAVDAVEGGTDDILRDLWGDPVDGIVTGDKCADAVAKRTGKIYDTMLKAFRKCNKDFPPPDQTTLDSCVIFAAGDPKVSTFAGKLGSDIANKCNPVPPIVNGTEDGECSGSLNAGQFRDCAFESAICNACLAINTSTDGGSNCDLLDNGALDASCGIAPHACVFDETTDNSDLDLLIQGNVSLGALVGNVSGSIDISCPGPSDGNGKRACSCELQSWTPVNVIGIGFVCIDPGTCPAGEIDCDGGNALGVDAIDDADIGLCTGNADCSSQCDTFCAGISKVQWRSGCERFCQGGTRNDLACICDAVGTGGCVGGTAGVDDCPGGSCTGKQNETDSDCQCQCIDNAVGGASSPGDMQCNLGGDLKVVASLPCSNPALVDLPPVCFPLTSQQTTGLTNDANADDGLGNTIGPNTNTGSPESCTNLDTSVTTGFELVTDVGFPDTALGDLRSILRIDCQ